MPSCLFPCEEGNRLVMKFDMLGNAVVASRAVSLVLAESVKVACGVRGAVRVWATGTKQLSLTSGGRLKRRKKKTIAAPAAKVGSQR